MFFVPSFLSPLACGRAFGLVLRENVLRSQLRVIYQTPGSLPHVSVIFEVYTLCGMRKRLMNSKPNGKNKVTVRPPQTPK